MPPPSRFRCSAHPSNILHVPSNPQDHPPTLLGLPVHGPTPVRHQIHPASFAVLPSSFILPNPRSHPIPTQPRPDPDVSRLLSETTRSLDSTCLPTQSQDPNSDVWSPPKPSDRCMIALGHLPIIFSFHSDVSVIPTRRRSDPISDLSDPDLRTLSSNPRFTAFLFRNKARSHSGLLLVPSPLSYCSPYLSSQCLLTFSTSPKLPSNPTPSYAFCCVRLNSVYYLLLCMFSAYCFFALLTRRIASDAPPSRSDLSPFRTKPLPNRTYVILTYSTLPCTPLRRFRVYSFATSVSMSLVRKS